MSRAPNGPAGGTCLAPFITRTRVSGRVDSGYLVVDPSSRGAPLRLDRPGTVSDHHTRGLPVTANAAARVPLARQAGLEPNRSGAKRCMPGRPEDETAVRESPDDDSDARQIGQRLAQAEAQGGRVQADASQADAVRALLVGWVARSGAPRPRRESHQADAVRAL